ncbi:hypothetical protein BGX26_001987 [Mortierella sp. AD094]|nr:hypothetical protein BGX26_001987 [Mortierella sp. AD094]
MAGNVSSKVDDVVIVVIQLEGLASRAFLRAAFAVKNIEFTLCCHKKKKTVRVEANATNAAFGMFRQLSILNPNNKVLSVCKIEDSTHSVKATAKIIEVVNMGRYMFRILLQAKTNKEDYSLESYYTAPTNILVPAILRRDGEAGLPESQLLSPGIPYVIKPHLKSAPLPDSTQHSHATAAPTVDDVVITVNQLEGLASKAPLRAVFAVKNVEFALCCYRNKKTVHVEATTANTTEFGMFRQLSILDPNNKILSVCKIEESTNSVKATARAIHVLIMGRYMFRILLQAKTNNEDYSLESHYTIPSNVLIPAILKPGGEPEYPESQPLPTPTPTPLPDSAQLLNTTAAPASTSLELPRPPLPSSGYYRQSIPMLIFSDLISEAKADISMDMTEGDSFDVHFFHCDQTRRVNVIGAHKKILKVSPKLLLLVKKTETARDVLAADMNFTSYKNSHFPSQAPVTVDISHLSLPAFRAVMTYIYTRNIETVFSNVSAVAVTSSSVYAEYDWSQDGGTEVHDGLTVLCMDKVLYLAQRFDVKDLVEAFTRLTIFSLTIDNVIKVLVHNAEFELIKRGAMDFIKSHFCEIFGGDVSKEVFKEFRDKLLYHRLKSEIMEMMGTIKTSNSKA